MLDRGRISEAVHTGVAGDLNAPEGGDIMSPECMKIMEEAEVLGII